MIVIYPMLSSKNVSSLVLPGVCKALERLILIYDMDSVAKKSGIGNVLGTMIRIIEQKMPEIPYTPVGAYKDDSPDNPNKPEAAVHEPTRQDPYSSTYNKTEELKKKVEEELKNKKIEFTLSSEKMLSLEPTWVEVKTSFGTKIIGIKVIPFVIEPTEDMGKLMFSDLLQKKFETYALGTKRKLTRSVYAFIRYFKRHLPGGFGTDLTGKPDRDIIFASTKYKSNIFALLSLADLEDDDFFHRAGGISKLFYLGWGSIIIADDVNKVITCCMKQFGGLCSSLSYSQLYANFGKEHLKVYDKMDDLKKSTTPFFRAKFKPSKLFSEQLVYEKVMKYSDHSDCVLCEEDDIK